MTEGAGTDTPEEKPVQWVGSSREDLRKFPDEVRRDIGFALSFAQNGAKHPAAIVAGVNVTGGASRETVVLWF